MKTTWRMLGTRDGVFDSELAEHDKQALSAIHQQQVEKYGKDLVGDFPDVLEHPVWISFVAERAGQIVDFAYAELCLEWCNGGVDAKATAALRQAAPAILQRFRDKGFRAVRTFIPSVEEGPIGKQAKRIGFKKQDELYAHYLLDLRGKRI